VSAEEIPRSSSLSASRLAAQLLEPDDHAFLEALRAAGRLAELDDEELLRIASEVPDRDDAEGRWVDLLELYYDAGGEAEVSTRRRRADRFFLQRMGEPATAASLVERLSALAPEIGPAHLERYGGSDEGPLVLRAGEHFAAVLDDYEEETETDEFDVSEAEARRAGVPMVTVRGLVRATNVLLDKAGVRERLVGVRSDLDREAYIAMGLTDAMGCADAGYLEEESAEEVMDVGAW
jgi:hypothetical protein